jgi:putative endonuclease
MKVIARRGSFVERSESKGRMVVSQNRLNLSKLAFLWFLSIIAQLYTMLAPDKLVFHDSQMSNLCVYIVQCSDGSYYTGVTNDVTRRIDEHNHGIDSTSYTFSRRPVALVYSSSFEDYMEAIAWEKHIKRWNRKKKEALMRGDENSLHMHAECKNDSHSKNAPPRVMVSGDEPCTRREA